MLQPSARAKNIKVLTMTGQIFTVCTYIVLPLFNNAVFLSTVNTAVCEITLLYNRQ